MKSLKGVGWKSDPYAIYFPQGGIPEYRFAPPRRWRFDRAWLEYNLAVEIEGGVWTGGRHTRGSGFVNDLEKYNHAVMLGWRILRFTPQQVRSLEARAAVCRLMGSIEAWGA